MTDLENTVGDGEEGPPGDRDDTSPVASTIFLLNIRRLRNPNLKRVFLRVLR